ncbi:hypothetical protein C8R46DRAFT_437933 [Mycena filopes]|nr:hypothetical protein C8R46DRAFT_437933 [Mycena filopes]
MRLPAVLLATSAFFLAAAAQGSRTAADVVSTLEAATKEAANVGDKYNAISSDIVTVISTAPAASAAFAQLNGMLASDVTQLQSQSPPAYSAEEQTQIAEAFKAFVDAAQSMLKTIIGKYGATPALFTAPVAANLNTFEKASDTLAFALISETPSTAEGMKADADALDATTEQAISTYSSPLGGSGIPGLGLKL